MGIYAKDIINQAKKWLGKRESDGSHKEIIDVYNGHTPLARGYKVKYEDSWCATFVSAVSIACNATSIIPTECGCEKMIELFKKLGVWVEDENRIPTPGDIIFYDWQDNGVGDNKGWSDHVGIVVEVDDREVLVIEGNNNNSVTYRWIDANGKYIRGYAVPKYDVEPVEVAKPTTKTIDEVAREVINGKWGNGSARREALEKAGYNYSEVQGKVNEILKPSKKEESKEPEYTTYTIQKGDTLTSIARKFYNAGTHSNVMKIANYNNIANPNIIRTGVTIKIPR